MNYDDLIDTRPGQARPFSPPQEVQDYGAWLKERYTSQQYRDGENTCLYGVAQKIHALIQTPEIYHRRIIAVGPYAGTAASFIENLARQHSREITVEVIPW